MNAILELTHVVPLAIHFITYATKLTHMHNNRNRSTTFDIRLIAEALEVLCLIDDLA